jgi:hypothetical protein
MFLDESWFHAVVPTELPAAEPLAWAKQPCIAV